MDGQELDTTLNLQAEVQRLKKEDGLSINVLSQAPPQAGLHNLKDPVTGISLDNFREGHLSYELDKDEIEFRIVAAAHILIAQKLGFDTENVIKNEIGADSNLYYQRCRDWVRAENLRLAEACLGEKVFVPEKDYILGVNYTPDSLRKLKILTNQFNPKTRISQEQWQKLEETFGLLYRNYPGILNLEETQAAYTGNFYFDAWGGYKRYLSLIEIWAKQKVISGVNNSLNQAGEKQIVIGNSAAEVSVENIGQAVEGAITSLKKKANEQLGFKVEDNFFTEQRALLPYQQLELLEQLVVYKRRNLVDVLKERKKEKDEQVGKETEQVAKKELERVRRYREERFAKEVQIEREETARAEKDRLNRHEDKELFLASIINKLRSNFKINEVGDYLTERVDFLVRIVSIINGRNKQYWENRDRRIKKILTNYGLDFEKFTQGWERAGYNFDVKKGRISDYLMASVRMIFLFLGRDVDLARVEHLNLRLIQRLEKRRPGMCKFLNENFGIYNFARYPVEVLIVQYDSRYKQDKPEAVIFQPKSDWNGAFYQNQKLWKSLYDQTQEKAYLRFYEWDSGIDITRGIIDSYRCRRAPALIWIAGHGGSGGIRGGWLSQLSFLAAENLTGEGVRRVNNLISEGAPIVMESCETGIFNGVAQKLSEIWPNHRVTAPETSTRLTKVKLQIENNNIQAEVEYRKSPFGVDPKVVYLNGKSVES